MPTFFYIREPDPRASSAAVERELNAMNRWARSSGSEIGRLGGAGAWVIRTSLDIRRLSYELPASSLTSRGWLLFINANPMPAFRTVRFPASYEGLAMLQSGGTNSAVPAGRAILFILADAADTDWTTAHEFARSYRTAMRVGSGAYLVLGTTVDEVERRLGALVRGGLIALNPTGYREFEAVGYSQQHVESLRAVFDVLPRGVQVTPYSNRMRPQPQWRAVL